MQNITVEAVHETAKQRDAKSQINNSNSLFSEKNYLNVRLDKDQTKKELKIRLLPIDKDSQTPFKIIHMHTVKVPTEISKSGWKSYVCLKKTKDVDHEKYGNKCPFCELATEAWKNHTEATDEVTKEQWKKIAKENFATDVCVVRCIERGHEEDGPKFWKFTIRKDGKDPYSIINGLMETRQQENIDDGLEPGCILDLYNGKDLKLTINAVTQDGKWTNKTSIDVVDYGREKPLSESKEEMEAWVNDEKKWSDVFVAKPYEYLSIIIDGDVPFYDKAMGQWVKKTDDGVDNGATELDAQIQEAQSNTVQPKVVNVVPDQNDLPF